MQTITYFQPLCERNYYGKIDHRWEFEKLQEVLKLYTFWVSSQRKLEKVNSLCFISKLLLVHIYHNERITLLPGARKTKPWTESEKVNIAVSYNSALLIGSWQVCCDGKSWPPPRISLYYIIFSFTLASANQIAAFTVQYKVVLYSKKLYCTVFCACACSGRHWRPCGLCSRLKTSAHRTQRAL